MSIEAITASAGLAAFAAPTSVGSIQTTAPAFSTLVDQIASLNQQLQQNEGAVQGLAVGDNENLHQVMMSLESARLQFDLLLQVRNKVLDAYQQLMSMQV
ncbi:MAG: flagellar hook-basal body complex protein FliE [Steroidobacteraceae bacterium]